MLAPIRQGEAVRRHQQGLGSVRDIVHDNLFLRLCVGEEELDHPDISPQHCRRFRWMILLFRYDTIEWVVGLLVAAYAGRDLRRYATTSSSPSTGAALGGGCSGPLLLEGPRRGPPPTSGRSPPARAHGGSGGWERREHTHTCV